MSDETLKKLSESVVKVPGVVLKENRKAYIKNFLTATHNTGRLMLLAGDQKI